MYLIRAIIIALIICATMNILTDIFTFISEIIKPVSGSRYRFFVALKDSGKVL